ncbi:MAG: hypothetical protein U5Q03_10855 [Bacteroidota bacterium]|nr:hypothetical protein [Bacteroidota bacterium]
MEIQQILQAAFEQAKQEPVTGKTDQERNRQRSIHWVESLAEEFRKKYPREKNYRVFSKYHDQNKDFGLNELLYDISVCKINYIESPKGKKLAYIEKAIWLVESEMAKDTQQLVYDFNKLLIGNSENKLFVGPLTSHNEDILELFNKIAVNCKGDVWLALVPHPGEWENDSNFNLSLFKLKP